MAASRIPDSRILCPERASNRARMDLKGVPKIGGEAMKRILSRYPRKLEGDLVLRPMETEDEQALAAFFKRIPVDERQLFKDDVTQPTVIRGWTRNLDYANTLPLLLFQGRRVVADATLHRDRRGWSRHVAEVRISLDPEFRGRGLALSLMKEFLEIAPLLQVAIVNASVLDVQRRAGELMESAGFVPIATLPQHAIDLAGRVHDVLVYSCTVVPPERMAPEASIREEEAEVGGG
jgi:RimJ/RimL family protein N-acetyltransferase